jgi:SAM-dependent methyltransferase
LSASAAEHEAIWHDVECGAYAADLAAWTETASAAPGPVLELGAGTGRVALHLAAAGLEVVAVDRSAALLDELRVRARARRLPVEALVGDAHALTRIEGLGRAFGAILAPMQLVQILGGAEARAAMLRGAAERLADGGVVGCALLGDDAETIAAGPHVALLPDVREVDGWIYSSQPLTVTSEAGEVVMRRLRQTVSPAGELTEERDLVRLELLTADRFEAEAAEAAGLHPRDRIEIPATPDHVGSTICVLEAG